MQSITGAEIVHDYPEHRANLLTAITANDTTVLEATIHQFTDFMFDKSNQQEIDWDIKGNAINNVEDFLIDLPSSLRQNVMSAIVSDKGVSKILGPSDLIFAILRGNVSNEEIERLKTRQPEKINNAQIAESPIFGESIVHDYRKCQSRILVAISEKDADFLNAINTSVETYLQNELNQEIGDWHTHQKSIVNLEEYFSDLTVEIRDSLSNLPKLFLTTSKWAMRTI